MSTYSSTLHGEAGSVQSHYDHHHHSPSTQRPQRRPFESVVPVPTAAYLDAELFVANWRNPYISTNTNTSTHSLTPNSEPGVNMSRDRLEYVTESLNGSSPRDFALRERDQLAPHTPDYVLPAHMRYAIDEATNVPLRIDDSGERDAVERLPYDCRHRCGQSFRFAENRAPHEVDFCAQKPQSTSNSKPNIYYGTRGERAQEIKYACKLGCGGRFERDTDRVRHELHSCEMGRGVRFGCAVCGLDYARADTRNRHERRCRLEG